MGADYQGVGRASGLRAVRWLAAPVLSPPQHRRPRHALHHQPAPWNDWWNLPVVGMTLRGHVWVELRRRSTATSTAGLPSIAEVFADCGHRR